MNKRNWIIVRIAWLAGALCIAGCGSVADQPAVNPDRLAPIEADRQWTPPPAIARSHTMRGADLIAPRTALPDSAREYGLNSLVELALRNNPRTRSAWQSALAAAAEFGGAQAPYFPQADVESDNGYVRTPFQLPGSVGAIKQWQADPVINVTYILLDFGRRHSAFEDARERLIASNFAFNRTIQEVVFQAQSAFYALDGALAAVVAAQRNLELARTDFDSVNQRVDLGLATEPELLLAKERVAQSEFDVANARLSVHDAQADLAVAIGVPADSVPRVETLESLTVPKSLGNAIEALIGAARRQRPDLAAKVADLRASDARVSGAQAQFYPTVGVAGSYAENLWNFTFVTPATIQTGQPQYSALLTLRWDLFVGLKHLNDRRQAEAEREAARADLTTLDIDAVAQVWRAYYEFESSLSKYEYAQSLVAATREAYAANLETYRQGLSTIVELLTAERDLANARFTLVSTKAEVLTASAAIAFAAGEAVTR